jgi:hypothetical protein
VNLTDRPELYYKTVAIDSASELSRLFFSQVMARSLKFSESMEQIRNMKQYPGATERLNILARRLKNMRAMGINVVIVAHEAIDAIYAGKASVMSENNEPAAIMGRVDVPGRRGPEEVMRVADNIFRVRIQNQKFVWMCKPEPIPGAAGAVWQVKDRFNAAKIAPAGGLPNSYTELEKKALALNLPGWNPPYIWIIYGAVGFQKTLSLLTFPRPLLVFDLDNGAEVMKGHELWDPETVDILSYDSENPAHYTRFKTDIETIFTKKGEVEQVKKVLLGSKT